MSDQLNEFDRFNALLAEHDATQGLELEQYLSFALQDAYYAVPITRVYEIRPWKAVTIVPNTPGHLCGLLNLRGMILPVIDLRLKLDMAMECHSSDSVMIVVTVKKSGELDKKIALVVDTVLDVVDVEMEKVKAAPDFGQHINTAYLEGLVTIGSDLTMLLDVDLLLSEESLA